VTLVLDATVLLNFGRVAAFWLMARAAPGPLLVLDEVVAEVRHPLVAVDQLREAIVDGRIRRHTLTTEAETAWRAELRQRTPSLGTGEAASLAACLANGWAFATDDRRARALATSLSTERVLPLSGTLGILAQAVAAGIVDLPSGEQLLEQMIATGYRAPALRLSDLLPR
jgi:predicted nucleic acid-binding protein